MSSVCGPEDVIPTEKPRPRLGRLLKTIRAINVMYAFIIKKENAVTIFVNHFNYNQLDTYWKTPVTA